MEKLLAALHLDQPDSLKRALVALLGAGAAVAIPALNPVLASHGLPSIPADAVTPAVATMAGLLATFLLQSGVKAGMVAIADAEAAGDAAGAAVPAPGPAAAVVDAMAGKVSP